MARVSFDFKKGDLVWISLIVVLLGASVVFAQWDSAKAMFHDSEDVRVTIDDLDYSLQEALDDGLIGGGMKFGDWVDKSSNYGAQQATTDGIVMAYTNGLENEDELRGYTDANSNPSTLRAYYRAPRAYADSHVRYTLTMPVKKDHYWKVEGSAGEISEVYWIPIISSGGSTVGAPAYDSGWQSQTWFPDGHKKITHGLGRMPYLVQVWLSSQPDGMVDEGTASQWTTTFHVPYGEGRGTYLSGANANDMWVYRDASFLTDFKNRAGTRITDPSTYYVRVVAW